MAVDHRGRGGGRPPAPAFFANAQVSSRTRGWEVRVRLETCAFAKSGGPGALGGTDSHPAHDGPARTHRPRFTAPRRTPSHHSTIDFTSPLPKISRAVMMLSGSMVSK